MVIAGKVNSKLCWNYKWNTVGNKKGIMIYSAQNILAEPRSIRQI